jgi:hypothetical protein
MGWNRQERFDKIPQRIWKQRDSHTSSRYLADEIQVSEVLLQALKRFSHFRESRGLSRADDSQFDSQTKSDPRTHDAEKILNQ